MRLALVATGKLLGDEDRLLGGEEELGRARHPLLDGSDDRRLRVAAEHRHVARVEVDVVVTVDVGERGAVATVDVDRQVVVRGHPRHRRPVRHVRGGAGKELERPRPLGTEPRELGVVQLAYPVPIEVAQRGHVGGGYLRTRTINQERARSPPRWSRSNTARTFSKPAFSYARCARKFSMSVVSAKREALRSCSRCRQSRSTARDPVPRSVSSATPIITSRPKVPSSYSMCIASASSANATQR